MLKRGDSKKIRDETLPLIVATDEAFVVGRIPEMSFHLRHHLKIIPTTSHAFHN